MSLWRVARCCPPSLLALCERRVVQHRFSGILATAAVPMKITCEPTEIESEVFLRNVLKSGGDKKDFMKFMRIVAYDGQLTSGFVKEIENGQEWLLTNLKEVREPAHVLGLLGGLSTNPYPMALLNEDIAKALFDKAAIVLPRLKKNAASFRLVTMVSPAVTRLRYYHEPFLAALHEWILDAVRNYHFPQCYSDGALVAGSFASAGYRADDVVSDLVEECARICLVSSDRAISLATALECAWAAVFHGIPLNSSQWQYLLAKNSSEFTGSTRYNMDMLEKFEVIIESGEASEGDYRRATALRMSEIRDHIKLEVEYVQDRMMAIFPSITNNRKTFTSLVSGQRPLLGYFDPVTKVLQPWDTNSKHTLVALVLVRHPRVLRPRGHFDGMVKYNTQFLQQKGVKVAVLAVEDVRGASHIKTAVTCLQAMQSVI